MLTEEDTFNALRRIPLRKMHILLKPLLMHDAPGEVIDNLLHANGWTLDEYYTERDATAMARINAYC